MQNGLLTLDWASVKSAIVSTLLVAVGATLVYIVGVGNVFAINWQTVINTALMAGAASLIKNFFTDNNGKLLGSIQIQ